MAVLAPALARLRSEINYRWPVRDHGSDGWIGDTSHSTTGLPENGGSDHNPNKRGVVDALDTDVDGVDVPLLVALAIRHPAVNYAIWNRIIWSRAYNFVGRRYTGSNPHTKHFHISLTQSVTAENNTTPWGVAGVIIVPVIIPIAGTWDSRLLAALPTLRPSTAVRGSVRKLQNLLNIDGYALTADGKFGPATTKAVHTFQVRRSIGQDSVVSVQTWTALLDGLATLNAGKDPVGTRRAQALLLAFGAVIKVDGGYGPKTIAAVCSFQRRYGLDTDGQVGKNTWTALLTR